MYIEPLSDFFVVRRSEELEKVRGLDVPDNAKDKPTEGGVLAVGPGKLTEIGTLLLMELKVGDRILFGKYAGGEFTLGGERLIVIRQDEVLGILRGERHSKHHGLNVA